MTVYFIIALALWPCVFVQILFIKNPKGWEAEIEEYMLSLVVSLMIAAIWPITIIVMAAFFLMGKLREHMIAATKEKSK